MDRNPSMASHANQLERQMAHLKILSRLLGHELHAQTGPKVTLSRDELREIQTAIDLFIEEFLQRRGTTGLTEVEPARVH